jgi:hypothetical protein
MHVDFGVRDPSCLEYMEGLDGPEYGGVQRTFAWSGVGTGIWCGIIYPRYAMETNHPNPRNKPRQTFKFRP